MAVLRIDETTSPAELREAVAHLRGRQTACDDEAERDALGEAIDEMVALIVAAERVGRA